MSIFEQLKELIDERSIKEELIKTHDPYRGVFISVLPPEDKRQRVLDFARKPGKSRMKAAYAIERSKYKPDPFLDVASCDIPDKNVFVELRKKANRAIMEGLGIPQDVLDGLVSYKVRGIVRAAKAYATMHALKRITAPQHRTGWSALCQAIAFWGAWQRMVEFGPAIGLYFEPTVFDKVYVMDDSG